MFVGRNAERSRVGELLADARRGRGRALVVSGPPGVGKSDLLARISADAEGWLVLSARGVPAEKDLPFSGLHQLLGPALAELDAIPAVQARALRGALGLGEPEPGHRLEVLAGTLSLLVAVAHEQPVLLVIDDAHQLDADSADALGFVARRLHVGGMALIAANASGQPSAFDDGKAARSCGWAGSSWTRRGATSRPRAVAEDVVERLWRDAGGKPLALTSLAGTPSRRERSRADCRPDTGCDACARCIYESRIFALPPETAALSRRASRQRRVP